MQFFEDGIGGGGPCEGLAVRVVGRDEVVDALHELFDAGERAAPIGLVGNQCEEAFDLIEPGAVGCWFNTFKSQFAQIQFINEHINDPYRRASAT